MKPCQPFSAAGRRQGASDERHMWPYFAEAIRYLRPRYVVLENVAGHRSMGFDRVLADLAGLRYDAQWCSLRASDVGAPHRRERIFVIAHASGERHGGRQDRGVVGQLDRREETTAREREWTRKFAGDRSAADATSDAAGDAGRIINGDNGTTPDAEGDGRHEGRPEPVRLIGGSDSAVSGAGPVALLPTPRHSDAGPRGGTTGFGLRNWTRDYIADLLPTPLARDGRQAAPGDYQRHTPSLAAIDHYLPTPAASDCTGGRAHPDNREGHSRQLIDYALLYGSTRWGKYESAIRRWEHLTRPAPSPTEPNTKGNPRLAAAFSEWLMGWPEGWVTDVPGISRNDALRIIGNGVVPQQAVAALCWLLWVSEEAA